MAISPRSAEHELQLEADPERERSQARARVERRGRYLSPPVDKAEAKERALCQAAAIKMELGEELTADEEERAQRHAVSCFTAMTRAFGKYKQAGLFPRRAGGGYDVATVQSAEAS